MTLAPDRPWDVYRAELADTRRSNPQQERPCVYCSAPTASLYRVCLAHDDLVDLVDLDPGYPAAKEAV